MPQLLKQAIVVACFALMIGAAPALKADPAPASAQPQTSSTNDPLHLTPDQQKKVLALVRQYRVDADKIIKDASLSEDQKLQKTRALQAAAQKSFDQMLTPDQLATEKVHRARVQQIAALADQYNQLKAQLVGTITPAERKQLETVEADTNAQAGLIMKSKTLTDDQKHLQMDELLKGYTQKTSVIYNPAQREIVAKMIEVRSKASALSGQP